VMDEVQAKREAIVITKHGKPVVKLVPAEKDAGDIYGFLAGRVQLLAMPSHPRFPAESGAS